jgi:DNA-directed RNA polymerase subunit RPC12/RpoP
MPSLEDQCYEVAAREVADGNFAPAAWAKALSAAMGDKEKVTPLYIKFRVAQLIEETAQAWQNSVIDGAEVSCPSCGQKIKGVRGRTDFFVGLFRGFPGRFQYSCPKCSKAVMFAER